ncbi:DUF3540 domain-containing protein [Hylemonella sp. W303a]|uniref:DUF3540 domain-containing protein n=1 Tax=Hylemonella sp. W303a TaxID=3389873 RepID=UPI00396B0186
MTISVEPLASVSQSSLGLARATVAEVGGPDSYRLYDGRQACRSASCLLQPQKQDQVLVWEDDDGACYIVSILVRPAGSQARLSVPGADELTLDAPRLCLQAESLIRLISLQNLELCASAGQLSAFASTINMTALDHLIQSAAQCLGQYDNLLLEAKGLARLHAQQMLLSAQHDLRADAERISMG